MSISFVFLFLWDRPVHLFTDTYKLHRVHFYHNTLARSLKVFSKKMQLIVVHVVKKFTAFAEFESPCRTYKITPVYPSLNYLNPVYTLIPYFFTIHFNIVLSSTPRPSKWSLPLKYSRYISCVSLLQYMLYALPISLI